jgi:heptosyltransferase-2
VILGPGGGLETKRWPRESFAALAAGLAGLYGENLSMLLLGGPGEKETVGHVATAASGARVFATEPGLREVFALVAASDLVVCNSSMLLHVAAAFGKRTLVLLGPAFPSAGAHQAQWGYPGLSESLGPQPEGQKRLCTPGEALDAVRRELAW